MKNLGYEINEDGITQYRLNGGCTERKSFYASNIWENVSGILSIPNLKKYCAAHKEKYASTLREAKKLAKIHK